MKKIIQLHFIPSSDKKFKHVLTDKCECGTVLINTKFGIKMLEHKKMGRGRDSSTMKFSISGTEMTDEKQLKALSASHQNNINELSNFLADAMEKIKNKEIL